MKKKRILHIAGKRFISAILSAALIITGLGSEYTSVDASTQSDPWLLSTDRPAYASSVNGGDYASYATDGSLSTQWGSEANVADSWIDIDLGGKADISKVVIDWQNESTYGVAYQILVSDDELSWTEIYSTTEGDGGSQKSVLLDSGEVDYYYYEDVLSVDSDSKTLSEGNGRYVRVLINYSNSQSSSDNKTDGWGAAIREIEIYGIGDENCIDPVSDAENIALDKDVEVTTYSEPWWSSTALDGSLAVDGDYDTYWLSDTYDSVEETCAQSLTVDLGETFDIGRVVISWQTEYANIWDLQVSSDGENFTTIYRQLEGNGEDEEIEVYSEGVRYVRMQGILMGRGSGYSIREIEIYEYESGDEKVTYTIPDLSEREVVTVGDGSYIIDDSGLLQPREPKYVTSNVTSAIPSNDWWTSIIYTQYSDVMPSLPMAYKYTSTGLSLYYADTSYTRSDNGGMGSDSKYFDLTIGTSEVTGEASAKLDSYGDYSVNAVFSDDDTAKMTNTLIKGSPYVYTTFNDGSSVELNINNLIKIFDGDGNEILTSDGEETVIDYFAVESENESEAPGDGNKTQYHYYGIYLPEGTTVIKVGSKLKINLGNDDNYMVVGALSVDEPIELYSTDTVDDAEDLNDDQALTQLNYMFKHAYSYVTDTTVTYGYENSTSKCTTNYTTTTVQKRTGDGIESTTLMCMFPTQWKYSDDDTVSDGVEKLIYTSTRGDLRVHEGNTFSYSQQFNGIIPQYTTPDESDSYNTEWMEAYLTQFSDSALDDYWVADPYWQGKKNHPIAMGILIADQLGEYELRDKLIDTLKKIMENWLTYDGDEDYPYYMYYSTSWGTLSGDGGDHGMAINLSDHHFLWAYFIFPAAVLASYDDSFVDSYGGMVEMLIRDCMNPDKDDSEFPWMRNFDPYEGHSWAGGYGDNNSGNNQESASEATFAWAGLYLWGLVTDNEEYTEAGIWGYTSEVNAIEQYWFNIDEGTELDSHNWPSDYGTSMYGDSTVNDCPYTGMVWGLGYTNGTYFSGNPCCIMGIHLLPVTPAITYMGYDSDKAAEIWDQYCDIQEAYQVKVAEEGNSDPEGWYHILWPFMSLGDAEGAAEAWDEEYSTHLNEDGDYVDGSLSTDEMANSYWYIQNMNAKGYIVTDIWCSDYTSYQIFAKEEDGETTYTAEVWNPSDEDITVHFADETGTIGTAIIPAHGLVDVDPTEYTDATEDFEYQEYESRDVTNTVPGVIEAEDYYTNYGCSVTTDDSEGEYVGWIDDGDMLVYTVEVEEEADYVVDYRVQCTDSDKNSSISIKTDNDDDYIMTTYLDNSTTSWKNVTADSTIHLEAGTYQIKLLFGDGGFNFNYVKIYKEGTKAPVAESDDLTQADLSAYEEIDLSNAEIVDVSSVINDNYGSYIIDGDYDTRWESEYEDPQYFTIDLQEVMTVGGIMIYWENAAAKNYVIETSVDNENWTTVFTQTGGSGGQNNGDENRSSGLESIELTETSARYVRIYCTERLTGYGDSIYEIRLFGENPDADDDYETVTTESTVETTTASDSTTTVLQTTLAAETETNGEDDCRADLSAYEEIDLSGASVIDVSSEINGNTGSLIIDGDYNTRWESEYADPQYLTIDLGSNKIVNGIMIYWENAAAKDYYIQTSTDNVNWTTVFTRVDGDGGSGYGDENRDSGLESILLTESTARYVRIYCVERLMGYGDSLYEVRLFGSDVLETTADTQTSNAETSTTTALQTTTTTTRQETTTTTSAKTTTTTNLAETAPTTTVINGGATTDYTSDGHVTVESPSGFTYTGDGNPPFIFEWQPVSGADYYNIYVDGTLVGSTADYTYEIDESFFTVSGNYVVSISAVSSGYESDTVSIEITVLVESATSDSAESEESSVDTGENSADTSESGKSEDKSSDSGLSSKDNEKTSSSESEDSLASNISRAKIKKKKFVGDNKIKLSLKKLANVDGYIIKISKKKKFSKKNVILTRKVTKTKLKIKSKKLSKYSKLYVKARAYRLSDGRKIKGRWSKIKKIKK